MRDKTFRRVDVTSYVTLMDKVKLLIINEREIVHLF